MKIAHVVCTYPPYSGGMGNTTFELVSRLIDRGHDVTTISPLYDNADETIDHAKRLAPALSFGNAAWMPTMIKYLDDKDIVHLHYPFFGTAGLVYRWKKKNPTKPLVVTYHMDNRGDGLKGALFNLNTKFFLPKIMKAADACIGSTFDFIEQSSAAPYLNTYRDKWHEIPFGVDTDRFVPGVKSHMLSEQLGINMSKPTLLFVGGMDTPHYFKGIPVLLKALYMLQKQNIHIQAVLVGDGNLREEYETLKDSLGLKHVYFAGKVSDDDLPEYYRVADALVLPSINSAEAFGMVLIEAFASGLPVMASDLPGVRSVAERAGSIVEPNNPTLLAETINNFFEQYSSDWKIRARHVAEQYFSWKNAVDKHEALYDGLLESSK